MSALLWAMVPACLVALGAATGAYSADVGWRRALTLTFLCLFLAFACMNVALIAAIRSSEAGL